MITVVSQVNVGQNYDDKKVSLQIKWEGNFANLCLINHNFKN